MGINVIPIFFSMVRIVDSESAIDRCITCTKYESLSRLILVPLCIFTTGEKH